jgi:hypothetical protein
LDANIRNKIIIPQGEYLLLTTGQKRVPQKKYITHWIRKGGARKANISVLWGTEGGKRRSR